MSTQIDHFEEQKYCTSCEAQMAKLGQDPNPLVALPERTSKHGLVVKFCAHCDPHMLRIDSDDDTS